MKIEVKKNLVIFRKPHEWETISKRLVETFGPSIMISWKTKRELGFTVRRHKGLVKWADDPDYFENEEWMDKDFKNRYHYEDQVHLDFYSESAMTYFLLKYIES